MALGPAVAADLQRRPVAQNGLAGERRLAQQIADQHGGELGLDQVEDPTSFDTSGVGEVASVQELQVIGPQEASVRFRLGPAVAAEAQRGLVAQDGVALEGRFQEQIPYYSGRELLLHQVEDVPALCARCADEVAGVCGCLVQEAGHGVVDLHLGPSRRPVLREGGRELAVQLRAGVIQRLRFCLRVIVSQIHVPQGVCNLLIHFGPRVEVQQSRDDLDIDLAAVVVARQSRADAAAAHGAARGVVGQLAGHEARDLGLVPVGHQLAGDEGQHLGLVHS